LWYDSHLTHQKIKNKKKQLVIFVVLVKIKHRKTKQRKTTYIALFDVENEKWFGRPAQAICFQFLVLALPFLQVVLTAEAIAPLL